MSIKLRDLIRNVRACKTSAEERAVIAKECALIRTSFKEEDNTFRHRNVAKLLFVHMLGYPTHFGQMEALKLIASPRFLDKRIGYLALSILVENTSEVLTLVTNSLSSDLNHRNVYVQGLALAALGNISNPDMLRDLCGQVLKLLSNTNVYVKKKAILCAVQIFDKVPDMVEDFVPVIGSLLQDRNHAVLLTATNALFQIAKNHPHFLKKVRKAVPQVVKTLKNLVLSGYAPEYDVNGLTDPFLQVELLQLLGVLGHEHSGASEAMNDILAQVATNTEGNRNAGNAILYECVRTIFSIDCEDGLRVLAINILGRFLQNRDNNIRYVALHMLGKVVDVDTGAVQRHRDTIVDCLRDADVSIRVRAIDLVFALISSSSIESLSKEIINYLAIASADQKKDLCSRLAAAAIKFAPSKQWHVHTLISMLCIAGGSAADHVWQTAVALIGQPESEEFRAQAIHRLYSALKEKATETGLVYTAVWALGEYAPLLFSPVEKFDSPGEYYDTVTENDVLDLLESTRTAHDCTTFAKGMIMTAYVKLTTRFVETNGRIEQLLRTYSSSLSLELQARSCEYVELVTGSFEPSMRESWLAQMPVPTDEEMALRRVSANMKDEEEDYGLSAGESEEESSEEESGDSDSSEEEEEEKPKKTKKEKSKSSSAAAAGSSGGSTNLLDLDDIFGGGASAATPTTAPVATQPAPSSGNQIDLLAGIFGAGGDASSASQPMPPSTSGGDDLLGMFGGSSSNGVEASFPALNAFSKDGINVTFGFQRGPGDKQVIVNATYSNSGADEVTNFVLQAAVPKFISLKMEPPSGNVLSPFGSSTVQQRILLVNSMQGQKPIVMKVKITYSRQGQNVVEQATINGFPQGL